MAVLTSGELQSIRNGCAGSITVNYTKTQLNAAAQAIEDWLTANSATVSGVINTATSPLVLTATQKRVLFAYVVLAKHLRDK